MFDLGIARISRISMHFLDHEEDKAQLRTTEEPLNVADSTVEVLIHQYVFGAFKNFEDYHTFTYKSDDASLNPLGILAGQVFEGTESFHETSTRIGHHLLQSSIHHAIKSGDLMVVKIEDVTYEDEMIDAIGIFKSERKDDFLKLLYQENKYDIEAHRGININKLDKGCIIFNTAASQGYVVASIDKTASNMDAQYWQNDFLNIKPLDDAFHQTQAYMNMAQTYVSHQLAEDVEINRGEQLTVLNDAGQFFKANDTYTQQQFEQEVLGGQPEVIESFQKYKNEYAQELNVDLPEQFGISNLAVKRNYKDFKSVLKLDKNFHVYIHGDRKMLEHGKDEDGRKYYKLYYEEES